ncbi:hypothetical protein CVT26_005933 [Gymnopilus dilepis]|uniref:Uncharacterized protein n=1 Tax=Gymnopilus dilepis TaxID=231916 RepID=A0A409Y1Q9_9AGAR|nr:hypothetical protein CVT26_005933 [Gymnopilus dilepis]
MAPEIDFKWKGSNLTTSWDRPGQAPESFRVSIKAALVPNGVGVIRGSGSAYRGKRFTIRHGRVNWARNTFSWDMEFSDGSPTEHFSMHMDPAKSSWRAELKLKNPSVPAAGPQYVGMYSTYRAWVTLR